jgi:RHS repeat-associated protein
MLPAGGNPIYYVEDMLGTSRVIATNTGTVCYDADFYPYGGERSYTNTCSQNYKFEGKERDTETGNDDFGARYYSNRFGRWLSADWSSVPVAVPYANLTNPQTLNLYAMVSDDPESFADLDGHETGATAPPTQSNGCTGDPKDCTVHPASEDIDRQQGKPTEAQETSPANMTTGQFLKEEVKGVADATIMPLVNIAEHPIDTIKQAFEGFSLLATSPVSTIKEAGGQAITEIKQTVSSALDGNPRAIGQVVGTAAALAYTANNVKVRTYPNADGAGITFKNAPTQGSRISFDVHRIPEANGGVRPHIDITIKKPGVPSGPGSNLVNIKHFPF